MPGVTYPSDFDPRRDPYAAPTPQPPQPPVPAPMSPYPYQVSPPQPPHVVVVPPPPSKPSSGLSVASMVLGIVGVTVCLCWTFGVPSILAIIFGHLGLKETKNDVRSGRGFAITGLITGYIGVAPAVILSFWMIVGGAIGSLTGNPTPTSTY